MGSWLAEELVKVRSWAAEELTRLPSSRPRRWRGAGDGTGGGARHWLVIPVKDAL